MSDKVKRKRERWTKGYRRKERDKRGFSREKERGIEGERWKGGEIMR